MRRRLWLLAALGVLGGVAPARAASFYLALSGNDSHPCAASQSVATPKATFASAWNCLSPGDTLLVGDGVYNQDASPPAGKSGSSSAPIRIQAVNDGQVEIRQGIGFLGNAFLVFAGFSVTAPDSAILVISNGPGSPSHHLTFQRIGLHCTATVSDGACLALGDGTHHVLVEDSWAWGGGRYTVLVYGGPGGNPPNTTADFNTFRRVVLRQGPDVSSGGNPQAGLALYYASDNLVENVIVLDSVPASDTSNAAFYLTAHGPPPNVSNNRFYGVLALNNLGGGWYLDHNGTGSGNQLRHSVLWDSADFGVALYAAGTCTANVVDHVTIGRSGTSDGFWNGCEATTFTSSIVFENGAFGISQSSSQGSMATADWNDCSSNSSGDYRNLSAGPHDLSAHPALRHLTRVEPGTPCVGAGEGGSDCGADLRLRYQDGALTPAALWPWPNEARLFKEMCTDPGFARGLCTKSSLTEYVWSYLGNPVPPEVGDATDAGLSPDASAAAADAAETEDAAVSLDASDAADASHPGPDVSTVDASVLPDAQGTIDSSAGDAQGFDAARILDGDASGGTADARQPWEGEVTNACGCSASPGTTGGLGALLAILFRARRRSRDR
ncbi:MAG: hypothetical protein HY901_34745 [Deltaproteobacteria bacterium]|nr:hypothetical protein [Deltaproteobacteria bacterium]